jgi:hypothetical protein
VWEIQTAPSDLSKRRRYASRRAAEADAGDIAQAYGETLQAVDVVNLDSGETVYSLRRPSGGGWQSVTPGGA